MNARLDSPVAVVTGSTRGIGRAIAEAFGSEGYRVVINGRDVSETAAVVAELRTDGICALGVPGDIRDEKVCQALVDSYSRIDVLVNNAGISPRTNGFPTSTTEMDEAEWQAVIDVNLTGAWRMSKLAIGRMIEQAVSGVVLFIASSASRTYSNQVGCHYIASKTAIVGLTHALAGEFASHGIRVCGIAPGRISTDMAGTLDPEMYRESVAAIPLKMVGEPRDVADAAIYLASPSARFITGTTLDINGGIWMS